MFLFYLLISILMSTSVGHEYNQISSGEPSLMHTFIREDAIDCGERQESVNLKIRALRDCQYKKWSPLPKILKPASDRRTCCYHSDNICVYEKLVSHWSRDSGLCLRVIEEYIISPSPRPSFRPIEPQPMKPQPREPYPTDPLPRDL